MKLIKGTLFNPQKAVFCFLYIPVFCFAQEKNVWTLKECISYAVSNNISVRQADVQARLSKIQSKQVKSTQIPSLGFSSSGGYQFGRSLNPSTYTYTNNTILQQTYSVQSTVNLFNWFSVRNNIKASLINSWTSDLYTEKIRNDITINVIAGYLQLLLAEEQFRLAESQIKRTNDQIELVQKQVDVGKIAELSVAQIKPQLATDSNTYYSVEADIQQSRLQLMMVLNLDASKPFDVYLPEINRISLSPLSELQPEDVFHYALHSQYQEMMDSLKVLADRYTVKATKGAMYPTVSLFGSAGSNYYNSYTRQTGSYPYRETTGFVNVGGNIYPVNTESLMPIYTKPNYLRQLFSINLNQAIGVSINVPIFNFRQLRSNYEKAKENLKGDELTRESDRQALQQVVYAAYNNAIAGENYFKTSTKGAECAKYAYDIAKKQFDIGRMSTSDYLLQENNYYQSEIKRVAAHYEYVFRILALEFYKYGKIKLYETVP